MTEVPIIFPSHVAAPQRYVVNDVEQSIRRVHLQTETSRIQSPLMEDGASSHSIRRGSASMSTLKFASSSASASDMLTTSALVEESRVLAVALSSENNPDSPVVVEIDLGSETELYANTVKVQAFVDEIDNYNNRSNNNNAQECIRLVLVADNAVVLTLLLRPDNLAPLALDNNNDDSNCVEVLNVRELLNDKPAMKEAVSGSHLHKTMVAFYAPKMMVLALSPLLMSVNLETHTCQVWLETQCLEEMKAKQSLLKNIWNKAGDFVFGGLEDGALVDMAPTAALCVSSTGNPLLDPTFVFTLHSDGKIKRWLVHDTSLKPIEVHPITPPDDLPNPRDWSDMYNSVYLAARLYAQVYVLAVHIQTNGTGLMENEDAESQSNSHLSVIHGGLDSAVQAIVLSSHTLAVPSETTSLVDMEFVPNLSSCSLMALFGATTKDKSRSGTTCSVLYPPSIMAIINTQPKIAHVENYLDGVAQAERARIEALVLSDELEGIATTSSVTLEEELHEMDSRFMKYLFRPAYPRGSGTVTPPQKTHIRNAIQKVVFGRLKHSDGDGGGKSIELETLQAVQEWRTRENRKLQPMSPTKKKKPNEGSAVVAMDVTRTATMTVYDSYVESGMEDADQGEDDYAEDDDDEMTDSKVNQIEKERSFVLEMHMRRWRRLLLAIWEEEQSLRSPLGLFALESSPGNHSGSGVLVRSGFTSILAHETTPNESTDVLANFDNAAIRLIKAIEADDNSYKKLFSTEQRIWNHMAKAQLDDMTPSDFAEECSRVVDFAFDSARGAVFTVKEQQELGQSLSKISLEDYFKLLQETPRDRDLPGLSLISAGEADSAREPTTPRNQIANDQVRQAVCSLTVRCIDSSRRLLLSRYLLVSYLVRSSRVSTAAFYLYLRSLAVLWASAQRVPMPAAFKGASRSQFGEDRPRKRLSFGDSSSSITGDDTTTTTLDNLLIATIQMKERTTESTPLELVVSLGRQIFFSSLRSTIPTPADVSTGKLWKLLPELGALPPASNPTVATDHPRIALRLVAPLVALASTQESPNVTSARKETLAECLLVESHKQMSASSKSTMRVKACELLASGNSSSGTSNARDVRVALELLLGMKSDSTQLDARGVTILAQKLQLILYGQELEIRSEIQRLVGMESVRSLFAPLFLTSVGSNGDVDQAVQVLAPKFLHLSNLIRRVDILEHHVGKSQGSNDLVLEFINSTIRELSEMFPPEFCAVMPENLSLYDRLFHNAVSFGEWNQAYDASVNNPSSLERRLSNFKRLANGMVDAGALHALLDKCSTLSSPSSFGESLSASECVDLYEIATEALEESCSRDLYLVRANSENPSTAAPDYQGSLYALHVSRGQWKSAAQSLDLRFVNAMQALAKDPSGIKQDSKTALLRDKLIVEDLVLASVGAANAIGLVHDGAAQFIVSGEHGENSSFQMHAMSDFDDLSGPKRQRQMGGVQSADQTEAKGLDRISQFMTVEDLVVSLLCFVCCFCMSPFIVSFHVEVLTFLFKCCSPMLQGRAAWSFAFRNLCLDTSLPFSAAKASCIESGSPCVDKAALDRLSGRGYYLNCLILTLAMTKSASSDVTGRNAFYSSLIYLLETTLVPLSLAGIRADIDDGSLSDRPSLSQLRGTLDNVGGQARPAPFVVNALYKHHAKALDNRLRALASALVQKLTCLHTNAEHPIGLEVANFFLDFDARISKLPCWLEQLMMGNPTDSVSPGGLFGGRPKPGCARVYLGDPSALLTLYTRQGMLLEACNVVTTVLLSDQGAKSREERAPSRLPEKGDIDFVPYKKIDILWSLIEKTISAGYVEDSTKSELRQAQDSVAQALERHFALLQISEVGIRSARILK